MDLSMFSDLITFAAGMLLVGVFNITLLLNIMKDFPQSTPQRPPSN